MIKTERRNPFDVPQIVLSPQTENGFEIYLIGLRFRDDLNCGFLKKHFHGFPFLCLTTRSTGLLRSR